MPESPTNSNSAQTGAQAAQSGDTALDQLLADWQKQGNSTNADPSQSQSTVSGATVLESLKPVVEFAQNELTNKSAERIQSDMDAAVTFLNEDDSLKGLKGNMAMGMLEAYAREDPTFAKSFEQRGESPLQWREHLEKARDWVKETITDFSGASQESVRDDLEAAKAAVQGQTNRADNTSEGPSAVEMFNMSDTDFEALKAAERAKASAKR